MASFFQLRDFCCVPFADEQQIDKELRARFGAAIRSRRKELGMSQDELSSRSGLARSYITEVETSNRNISLFNIGRLTRALELTISALFRDYDADYPAFYDNQHRSIDAESFETSSE